MTPRRSVVGRAAVALLGGSLLIGAVPPMAPTIASAAQDQRVRADDALQRYYGQTLTWEKCGTKLECAWLTVPLDYARPDGATIALRLSRIPATGTPAERQGSLVVNPGGPGASGLQFASSIAGTASSAVTRAFDIVGFDPRGVGRSAPIECLSGAQTTRWLLADATPDTPAEERKLMALAKRLADGCLARSAQIARHVGTENTVRDLDILRSALGDPTLNLFGFSYGTYLGALFAEQFPDRVGRFVLDGAVDPALDVMQVSQGQSRGFQVAFERFARDCVTHADCPWRSPKAVLRGISALLADLDGSTLPSETYPGLVQSQAETALFYAMYSPALWAPLRTALKQATIGDGLGLQTIADYASDRTGPNSYDTNMASAFPAIGCWDSPAAPGAAGLKAAAAQWSKGAPIPELARAMAWGNAVCSQWYGHSTRVPGPVTSSTKAPILIIGTVYDPATPYAWAKALSRQLPTSTLLTFRGDGHTAYGNSRCIDNAVDAYLVSGVLPPPGTICG